MYSTIRQKYGNCQHPGCKTYGPLTKKLCGIHYWSSVKLKSVAKMEEKELTQNESLSSVIDDLDVVFSQFIRLRDSDENGYVTCYCRCGSVVYWTEADCMHFIPRIHKNTRFSEDNCKGGCKNCNQKKYGNLIPFGEHLEEDRPGSVEALEDQGRVQYNFDIPELKALISYYAKEVKHLKKKKPLKS